MTQSEIRQIKDAAYANIVQAENALKEIRKICKHTSIFEGNYSYRVGVIQPAVICSDCGNLIKTIQ